jgi:hypothetical protein
MHILDATSSGWCCEDVQAKALRNAYAIDMLAQDTLTRRRERIACIHGLSIDTIELPVAS